MMFLAQDSLKTREGNPPCNILLNKTVTNAFPLEDVKQVRHILAYVKAAKNYLV
jgi:hypothetical protein